ncbi:MAG TPA: SPOR domain-containing protein [bacterium]|nr:SPOR domain-containing protein [bacterium]HPN34680.1 SPOR domain-containing protein [bacterium]
MARKTALVFYPVLLLLAGRAAAQPEVQQLMTLWQNGRWEDLQKSLPAAVAKYPDHPNTLFFSALFERDGDAAYRKYKAGWNGLSAELMDDALMRLAQYQQVRGEFDRARQTYQTLAQRYPSSPLADDARYQRCQCLLAEGKTDSAKSCLIAFIQQNRKSSYVDWAVQDLEAAAAEPHAPKAVDKVSDSTPSVVFYIQVGAYRVIANARQYVKKLQSAGFDAEVVEKKTADTILFAVWIGPFDSRDKAADFAKKNVAAFAPEYVVVQKPQP